MPSRVLTEEEVQRRRIRRDAPRDAMDALDEWLAAPMRTPMHAYPAALRAVGVIYDGHNYREVGDG
jgi:hypothetical protein